jgi:hypothetical protein
MNQNKFILYIFNYILVLFIALSINSCEPGKTVTIKYDSGSNILSYAVTKLISLFESYGYNVYKEDLKSIGNSKIVLEYNSPMSGEHLTPEETPLNRVNDGYMLSNVDGRIEVIAINDRGCLYGIMDLIEQLKLDPDLNHVEDNYENPALSFRAIKFNLPWAPYRPGPATDIHLETCRDLKFWESFLDMMVENRFNALSLWSTHIFPYMIRSTNYPDATPFDDNELSEWKEFWKTLFRMARDRGIETYLVNWNIVVSESFANHYGAKIHDDRSDLVKKYTSESVTQLINEYQDLTGLGVTLADWMGNWGEDKMTPIEREKWIEDTFIEGMKKADRHVKFIHRAVLAGDPKEMRKVIDQADLPDKTIVEVKFNWSHGHSTPDLSITHANDEGTIMREFWDPDPSNYFIAWMIRNEDFFVLRWGNPEFIRDHIKQNTHKYVDGYFIGSEGYIPAADYSTVDLENKSWTYAFEKQWLFYSLWGRLMYDPEQTNESLTRLLKIRYENTDAAKLLAAYSIASEVPLKIASFYKGTWDFTLYSEGFLAPWPNGYDDGKSPFISVEELMRHETLDKDYLSISSFCTMILNNSDIDPGKITPVDLADLISDNCLQGLKLIHELKLNAEDPTLMSELDDLETWCYLGFYFADKIRAGVSLKFFIELGGEEKRQESLDYLENCINYWEKIIQLTQDRYKPMPYVSFGHHEPRWPEFTAFHWKFFIDKVKDDLEFVKNLADPSIP